MKTILLVEDEAVIALKLERLLKKNPYDVKIAYSGEEAVAIIDSDDSIDLVLIDIDLGRHMDGTAAAEIIMKKRPLPVVFLSNHTDPEIVERTYKITSYGYIVKNSGDTVLLASLEMTFRLYEARKLLDEKNEKLITANEILQATVEELEDIGGKKISHSETILTSLFEGANDGILVADMETKKFVMCNGSFSKMTGYSREETMYLKVDDLHPKEDLEYVIAQFEEQGRGEIDIAADIPVLKKDGSVFYCDINSSAIMLNGRMHLMGVFRDVMVRRNMDEALKKAIKEKASLLSELQHRMKNSMAVIISIISLEMEKNDNPGVQEILDNISNRISVLSILYDMLSQAGGAGPININAYFSFIIQSVTNTFPGTGGISIENKIEEVYIEVKNATSLGIILNELLTNIFKYAFPAGMVGRVFIYLKRQGDTIILDVGDNGIPMPAGFSLDSVETLGLSITRDIINQMDGTIELLPGAEKIFRIMIPLAISD